MSSAILTVTGVTLPTSAPIAAFDELVVPGTISVWDAKNVNSWPLQAAPTALNHSWLNLVDGGTAADLPTTWTWNTSGGFIRPGTAATSINLGTPDLTNRDVVITAWIKVPSVPAALTPLVGRAQSTAGAVDNQFMLAIGSDGKPILHFMPTTSVSQSVAAPNVITAGVHHFGAVFRRVAGQLFGDLYVDNVLVNSVGLTGTTLNSSTYGIALGDRRVGNGGGTTTAGYVYYRAAIGDLTASGRTGAAVVAADWTIGTGDYT